jgi:hypothetical protein
MQFNVGLLRLSFWLATIGLVTFCLAFGTPFLAAIPARKILEFAGCSEPGFDTQAVCPEGSFAQAFIPISHWLGSAFAPLVLIKSFGVLLIVWFCLCVVLDVVARRLELAKTRLGDASERRVFVIWPSATASDTSKKETRQMPPLDFDI